MTGVQLPKNSEEDQQKDEQWMRNMGIIVYHPKAHFYQAPREFDEQDEAGSEAPSESQRDSSFMIEPR